jgi:hypothetical protein
MSACTLKSSKLDEDSEVQLQLRILFRQRMIVQQVDLQKHIIIFDEENSTLTIHGGKLLRQTVTLHCHLTCSKRERG